MNFGSLKEFPKFKRIKVFKKRENLETVMGQFWPTTSARPGPRELSPRSTQQVATAGPAQQHKPIRPAWQSGAARTRRGHRAPSLRAGTAVASSPVDEVRRGGRHKHPQSLGSSPGYAQGGKTHHVGLMTVDGGKGLRARVLNGGEGVPVGGDNSRELLQVGKREGSVTEWSDLDGRARWGRATRGGEKRSTSFEPG
jgi:hypothetical protein